MTEQEAKAIVVQLTYEEKLALRSLLMSLDHARGKDLGPCIHKGAG